MDLVPSKSWSIIIIIYLPRYSCSSLCFPTRDLLCPQRGSAVGFLLLLTSLLIVLPDGYLSLGSYQPLKTLIFELVCLQNQQLKVLRGDSPELSLAAHIYTLY